MVIGVGVDRFIDALDGGNRYRSHSDALIACGVRNVNPDFVDPQSGDPTQYAQYLHFLSSNEVRDIAKMLLAERSA